MVDIQSSWIYCELKIDNGYARKSKLIAKGQWQIIQAEFACELQEALEILVRLQDQGFEVINYFQIYYGEVSVYHLARKAST